MKTLSPFLIFIASVLVAGGASDFPAPLFKDPNYHGSCDPEIVWNPGTREWMIFYTARRATRERASYVGTPLGVITSKDLRTWTFAGYCSFDGHAPRPDLPVSFWAPGIIEHGGELHVFVTYKDNAQPPWGGRGVIRHFTAPLDDAILGWREGPAPDFTQPDPIDATLVAVDGGFRAYYRVGQGGGICWSSSKDLKFWKNHGKCPGDINLSGKEKRFGYQEAPYVFRWRGSWWMLTDPHEGLAVYRSDDGVIWEFNTVILKEDGKRPFDNTRARHPSVAVMADRAVIYYHVEPWRPYPTPPAEERTVEQKRSFLQAAELDLVEGKLTCDR